MKRWSEVFLYCLLTIFVVACGHETSNSSTELALPAASSAEPASGGYEPAANERVPGITMSQQELDRIYAEARRNMPVPVIPQDSAIQDGR
jgi:hypothetical protein